MCGNSAAVDHVRAGVTDEQKSGPPPRSLPYDALSALLATQQFGVLATNKRSGHPHLTTMLYHWDPDGRTVRFSTTADRVKVRQLAADPRAALHVASDDRWSFAVAEGEAEVSDVTTVPGDAVGQELLDMLPAAARPADASGLLAEWVAERRVVIRLRVSRVYGTALDVG
jgi:PPOX class probable F420-dependent enzyme